MADDPQVGGTRPLDPTKNAEDLMGNVGASGITTGGAQQTSASPGDTTKDSTDFRGGVLNDPTKVPANRQDPTQYSDKAYNKQVLRGMSSVAAKNADDEASGRDVPDPTGKDLPPANDGYDKTLEKMGNATQEDAEKNIMTQEAPFENPDNLGAQDAAGGTMSAPETDDDVGEMNERVGLQKDKDGDDPQEVDIAGAIDEAEEEHLHS